MKFFTAVAAVVLLYSGAVMAQAQGDKAAASASGVRMVTGNEAKHARHADARHCLDMKSDVQIVRCAEKYLQSR